MDVDRPMRIQIATTLIAIPSVPRRSAFRPIRIVRDQSGAAAGGQLGRAPDAQPVEEVASDHPQGRQAVHDAPPEADRRGLLEVAGRDGDLADARRHPGRHDLGDELLVEHEVVAVELVRDRLEQVPAVGPQPGVVLGQVQPEGQVLDARSGTGC